MDGFVDVEADNPSWPGSIEPPLTRVCIQCGVEYARRMASGRLRSPQRWRRSIYCGKHCAAQYRGRWKALPLAGLDLPAPLPKPKLMPMPGRPSRKTGVAMIAKVERAARVMELRCSGMLFREIAAREGVSTQAIHRMFWKAVAQNPPNRRRHRRLGLVLGPSRWRAGQPQRSLFRRTDDRLCASRFDLGIDAKRSALRQAADRMAAGVPPQGHRPASGREGDREASEGGDGRHASAGLKDAIPQSRLKLTSQQVERLFYIDVVDAPPPLRDEAMDHRADLGRNCA